MAPECEANRCESFRYVSAAEHEGLQGSEREWDVKGRLEREGDSCMGQASMGEEQTNVVQIQGQDIKKIPKQARYIVMFEKVKESPLNIDRPSVQKYSEWVNKRKMKKRIVICELL